MKELNRNHANCERWIWIELIGFDNTKSDLGVQEYLDRTGFIPETISLLISSPDIVHYHDGLENAVNFPADFCAYFGHPRNAERERQVWTNHQLKNLIAALRSHSIQVLLSTFTCFLGNRFAKEWVGEHQELLEIRKSGESNYGLLPLKRLADGTYYEDFFIPQLAQTLQDYQFDGWHAADGWGPGRLPIFEADYSDDMFEQFMRSKHIEIPADIDVSCDQNRPQLQERAEWIWKTQRLEWIDFYTSRWAEFHKKQATALHENGKKVFINSAWTRDPFEARYRYGVDYQKIIAAGVDGIVTESAAAASDMEAQEGFRLYNYTTALLLIKAFVPDTKLYFLNGVKDVTEQWDVIRHTPTVYESEIQTLSNVYFQKEAHQLERCADGFVVCLGDSIRKEEWQWLRERWDLAFDAIPQQLAGATLVWSDAALHNEIDNFIEHRNITTHRLLYTLMEHGAQVQSAVRIENIESVTGNLLILNAHLLPDDELAKVLLYEQGSVILIGEDNDKKIYCRVRTKNIEAVETLCNTVATECNETVIEPITFLISLPMQEIPQEFFAACAGHINAVCGAPTVSSGESFVNLQALKLDENRTRLIIRNSRISYCRPRIDVHQPIDSIEIKTAFPCADIVPDNSQFAIKVPGRGVVVVDVIINNS